MTATPKNLYLTPDQSLRGIRTGTLNGGLALEAPLL